MTYFQTLEKVPWFLRLQKPKNDKTPKKLEKSKLNQKIVKICDIKKLKNYSMANKTSSVTYYQNYYPLGGFLAPRSAKTWIRKKFEIAFEIHKKC